MLLIADLEGITGVDRIEQLVVGGDGYDDAIVRMNEEVSTVARLLLAHGVQHVRVSDTHHSGATNLDASFFPGHCELVTDVLVDDVDAVACVGMHAEGRSHGFAAHTVNVNTEWTWGDERLTETRIVQLLAAERGVPFWFSSGDDVLATQVNVPFVITKTALSRGEARSLSDVDFRKVLEARPVPAFTVPQRPLRLRFQTRAEGLAANSGEILGATFHDQFRTACEHIDRASDVTARRITGEPGTREYAVNAARLLLEKWE